MIWRKVLCVWLLCSAPVFAATKKECEQLLQVQGQLGRPSLRKLQEVTIATDLGGMGSAKPIVDRVQGLGLRWLNSKRKDKPTLAIFTSANTSPGVIHLGVIQNVVVQANPREVCRLETYRLELPLDPSKVEVAVELLLDRFELDYKAVNAKKPAGDIEKPHPVYGEYL